LFFFGRHRTNKKHPWPRREGRAAVTTALDELRRTFGDGVTRWAYPNAQVAQASRCKTAGTGSRPAKPKAAGIYFPPIAALPGDRRSPGSVDDALQRETANEVPFEQIKDELLNGRDLGQEVNPKRQMK
jgi:hypothetical protein